MMQARTLLPCVLALLASTPACSSGPPAATLGRFSFDYFIVGDGPARPVQVFDNGTRTYLQFRPGSLVPALVSVSGEQIYLPLQEGPYTVIEGTPRDLVAQMGPVRVRITHASLVRNAPQVSPSGHAVLPALPSAAPSRGAEDWSGNSYATPARGDRLQWVTPEQVTQDFTLGFPAGSTGVPPAGTRLLQARSGALVRAQRIEVMGRDDGSLREGLAAGRAAAVADQLVAAGIPRARIELKVARELRDSRSAGTVPGASVRGFSSGIYAPAAPQPAATRSAAPDPGPGPAAASAPAPVPAVPPTAPGADFEIRAADATLEGNLRRWAQDHGWRLVVQGAPEVPVLGDAPLAQRDFLAAADYAIVQARAAGHRIRAAAYSNNVLVLTSEETP